MLKSIFWKSLLSLTDFLHTWKVSQWKYIGFQKLECDSFYPLTESYFSILYLGPLQKYCFLKNKHVLCIFGCLRLFNSLHVLWQVSFGCWVTWSISSWQKYYNSVFFPKAEWWVAELLFLSPNNWHTTFSWNINWQKCAGMGLNGFHTR